MKTPGKTLEGSLVASDLRLAIVCARFNEICVSKLLDGAMDNFVRHGGDAANVTVAWVPGSYEIPTIVAKFAESGKFDAVVALGVVIQGATSHAGHINSSVAGGLSAIARDTGVPVIDCVLGVDTIEQALERSGSKQGNRGASAAQSAIEMANLCKAVAADLA
ncbi:MAG: 6,7-dimethyl-8-ribityllumazine synthase [Rhodothermales bacterium]|jgi:6,7-dimethyl-8-ribityllumazine synthase